jgi:hypothetical protein
LADLAPAASDFADLIDGDGGDQIDSNGDGVADGIDTDGDGVIDKAIPTTGEAAGISNSHFWTDVFIYW